MKAIIFEHMLLIFEISASFLSKIPIKRGDYVRDRVGSILLRQRGVVIERRRSAFRRVGREANVLARYPVDFIPMWSWQSSWWIIEPPSPFRFATSVQYFTAYLLFGDASTVTRRDALALRRQRERIFLKFSFAVFFYIGTRLRAWYTILDNIKRISLLLISLLYNILVYSNRINKNKIMNFHLSFRIAMDVI